MMLAPRAVKRKVTAKAAHATGLSDSGVSTPSAGDAEDTDEAGAANAKSSAILDGYQAVDSPANGLKDSKDEEQCTGAAESKIDNEQAKSVASTSESKKDRKEQERLNLLRFTVEECLSDWGLSCLHPELLQTCKDSKTGYVHLSNLVSLPTLASQAPSMPDITAAFTAQASDTVELDETGFQIRRRTPPDYDELVKTSVEDWAERTLYLENVPKPPKGQAYTLDTLRDFLSRLFDTNIDALRLPPFYVHQAREKSKSGPDAHANGYEDGAKSNHAHQSANATSLQFDAPVSDSGKVLHQYAVPQNGGPFKGFAFVVINDGEKGRGALEKWSWDSKGKRAALDDQEAVEAEDGDDSASEVSEASEEETVEHDTGHSLDSEASTSSKMLESHQKADNVEVTGTHPSATLRSPTQLATRSGLCIMPIERFNQLRLEYLRYSRDITVLKEKQEALHENSFSRRSQRRSASPMRSRNQRRSPSPDKWERKARSPSPEKWERKALSPQRDERRTRRYDDLNDDDYPRGCVCFVKRFHPEARGGVLKTLFQAILELEEVCPKDYLQHVDHRRNVDSCHVRFKDAATASFFASYFSGNPKYSHVDPNSTDPNEAFAAVRKSDTIRPMEAEVIAGIPEAIYWSTVPKAIRKASSGVAKGTGALDADVDTTTAIDVTAVETDPVTARPGVDEGAESIASRKRSLDSPASGAVEVNDGGRSPKQARLATIDDN